MSPRKFPDAEESRESRLSSRVFKVILKPFCCFVRFDYKVKDTERRVWKDVRRLVKTRAKGQSHGHERASEQLQRSIYAGEMKLVFAWINGHQKPHPPACDGIVNADGSISHVWIEKQTHTLSLMISNQRAVIAGASIEPSRQNSFLKRSICKKTQV